MNPYEKRLYRMLRDFNKRIRRNEKRQKYFSSQKVSLKINQLFGLGIRKQEVSYKALTIETYFHTLDSHILRGLNSIGEIIKICSDEKGMIITLV